MKEELVLYDSDLNVGRDIFLDLWKKAPFALFCDYFYAAAIWGKKMRLFSSFTIAHLSHLHRNFASIRKSRNCMHNKRTCTMLVSWEGIIFVKGSNFHGELSLWRETDKISSFSSFLHNYSEVFGWQKPVSILTE